jgi:hypothetical protein
MNMNNETRYVYVDTNSDEADWPKKTYDLLGVNNLRQLAKFLRMENGSPEFRRWLRTANQYPWVDDAPTEIRIAIRAHADFEEE